MSVVTLFPLWNRRTRPSLSLSVRRTICTEQQLPGVTTSSGGPDQAGGSAVLIQVSLQEVLDELDDQVENLLPVEVHCNSY